VNACSSLFVGFNPWTATILVQIISKSQRALEQKERICCERAQKVIECVLKIGVNRINLDSQEILADFVWSLASCKLFP
jgi:hypothetical protein